MPIGLFFCPSVEHIFEATRTAGLIEVPFGVWTRAQGNMYWMRSPTKKVQFRGACPAGTLPGMHRLGEAQALQTVAQPPNETNTSPFNEWANVLADRRN